MKYKYLIVIFLLFQTISSQSQNIGDSKIIDVAHNIVKAITRGGDPAYYEEDEIIDDMLPIFEQQQHQYTIQTEKLPYKIPYINFDVPNTNIDILKNALYYTIM